MTTSRRLAPLPLRLTALLALLVLGGVLLWSTPADAQTTSRILVSNVSQGNDDSAATSGNDHAQLFHTGAATNGFVLTSVIVVSEDTAADDFDVDVCDADSNGFPTSPCTGLAPPSSFAAGNLEFTAPGPGIALKENDNYVVVIKQIGTGSVTLDSTTSAGEDSTGLTGWSVKNKFDFKSSGAWQHKGGGDEAIQITVNGYESPANQDATGRPRVLASAEGAGILFADTEAIADGNGLPIVIVSSYATFTWSYQWIRVDGMTETNVGADSASYQPVDDDVGKLIKVEVSFTDGNAYPETVTSLPFGPIGEVAGTTRPATTLVSNTGQTPSSTASITQRYAQGFRLGDHGQGYEISSVSIDLAAAPSSLTVSLWSGAVHGAFHPDTANKLFDFANPSSFAVGLNEFTAPAGAFAYPNVNYFVVLSGFGASLSINQTTSDNEDTGGEPGAVIYNNAAVRAFSDTGHWDITSDSTDSSYRASVLRLAVEGAKRTSGILASTYAQPVRDPSPDQEIISLGDDIGYGITLGEADRYLIRGVSLNSDDTTSRVGGWTNPFDLNSGTRTGATQFTLVNSRNASGLPVWTAPQGATVTGGREYVFDMPVGADTGDEKTRRRNAILTRTGGAASNAVDRPAAAGVTFTGGKGDVALVNQLMALLGVPLYAMVQNLGQADNSYASATATNAVLSQGFTTGPNAAGYRLQGIGFNIEGSGSNFPDGPMSVSVAVHADSGGKPGAKLFDLVSPTEFAAGHSFFEAPPGTTLEASTSYVLVWSHLGGAEHRLQRTLSDNEDSGALAGFSIANVFYRGADVDNLTANSTSNALEIAVYTDRDLTPPTRVTDFDLHSDNSNARGIWGNDETIWVANNGSGATDKLYAYNRSDGSRDSSSDFDNLNAANNNDPSGICSDGTTMFVADRGDNKIYAYRMSNTTSISTRDVTLNTANDSPQGLSCDSAHLWVAEDNDDLTSKIFVYLRSDGSHASTLDIGADKLSPSTNDDSINNNDQRGMWSNDTTLFVVDHGDTEVYAYKLSDRTRDEVKGLDLVAANANPWGLWFDGRVLWVADNADNKLYVYDLLGAQPDNTPADGVPVLRTPTTEDVWTATLTAAGSPFGVGYNSVFSPTIGTLSPSDTFIRSGVTYTIDELVISNSGDLDFRTNVRIPQRLILSIDGTSYSSTDAIEHALSTGYRYKWENPGISWSSSETISVVLTVEAAPDEGTEVRADVSGITDATDGLSNVFYHYQWIRDDGTDVTELDGETGGTYTATADDVGNNIQVRVVFDDDAGNKEYPRYSRQVMVPEIPPVVTGVALTSDPNADGRQGNDGTYAIADSVTATVTFDKGVDITGSPQITLLFGTTEKAAGCAAATNATTMECSYEVVANDTAPSGAGINANSLVLNSGTIYATGSTTNAATLTHLALALQSGHKVDGIRPTLVTTGNNSPRTSGDGTKIILTFNKNIDSVDRTNITILDSDDVNNVFSTSGDSISGRTVEITLTTALTDPTTNLIIDLGVGAVTDAVGNSNADLLGAAVLIQLSAAPSAPTGLTAEPAPDETPQLAVDLSWHAPTSDGGSAITSHQYRYKVGSGSLGGWTTIDNSAANGANATSFTVKGLPATATPPIEFTFEVRAINANGNGSESDPATATIDVPDTISVFTTTIGNQQVEFAWATPANNGSAILRYQYYVYNATTSTYVVANNTNIPNSDASTTSFTITGLINGVNYEVGIRAVNTVGGAGYDPGSVTPMAGPPGKPSVTVQSRVAALYVSWTVADDGGSNITEYQVQWKSGAQTFGGTRSVSGLTTTSRLIENLINGTEYDVRVRAMNSAGWGEWSEIKSETPVAGPAVSLSTAALSIDEGRSDAYFVVLTTEPTAPVTIGVSKGGDVTTQPITLRFTASNWETRQRVTVNAGQDGDADDDTVPITHTVLPGSAAEYVALTDVAIVQVTVLDDDVPPPPVRGFSAIDESQDAIAVGWWSERGAAEYELEYRKRGDTGDWTRVTRGDFDHLPSTTGNRSLTAIATGLDCNTTYDFRIRLRGSGDILLNVFGPHTEVSHKTGQCAQPDRPTNLMYTLAPDCATLTWTAPTGGDYTGVRIRRLTRGEENWTLIHQSLNSRPTSYRDCTHTGDGYGDGDNPEYAYRVTYVKFESGLLVESKHAKSSLRQYGPALQDHHHATPRNVRLTVDTDSQRTMTWEAPPSWSLTIWAGLQGASVPVDDPWITGYVVERREFRAREDGYLYFPEPEDELIWSATMTVGTSITGAPRPGYFPHGSDDYGALTQTTFTHYVSQGTWTVTSLFVIGGELRLTIQETPPTDALSTDAFEDWVLVVDGRSFPFELPSGGFGGGALSAVWRPDPGLNWFDGQQVSVQLVERELFEWERLRRGRDGDTSTSFTDNEQANDRKFVYRVRTANQHGISTTHAIFDWLWDNPYRDAVIDLAATDTTEDNASGSTGDGSANTPASGAPTITGTPQVGQTLTASTSGITDADGLTNAAFSYRWTAGGSDIGGATGSTYTLTASEQGQTIQVRVSFTDDADNEETLTSEATVAVAAAASAPLTAAFQDLPDSHDGSTAFTFQVLFSEDVGISYVNMRDDAFSLSEGDVTGARRVDGRNDLWEITVEPDGDDGVAVTLPANRSCTATGAICTREDSPRQLTNSPTATVTGPAGEPSTNTSAAGAPTISGTPQVGETLTADTSSITDEDGLTNVSYSYQWIAGGSDIAGATGSSYTLTSNEVGQTVQVRVTFTDDADNEETLTSAATAVVAAAPAPLTASFPNSRFQSSKHKGTDDRPQVIVAFSLPVASFEKTTPSVAVTGAAVSRVRRHQEDGLENAWIFFLDPDGNEDIAFRLVTGQPCDSGGICTEDGGMLSGGVQVTLPGPEEEARDDQQTPQSPPAKPTGLTATVNADGHIVLSWTAPNDDSITGYQVLRRLPSEGESALLVYVADTESTATTFTDTGVTAGVKHVYRVKAINAAGLSGWSNYVNPTP